MRVSFSKMDHAGVRLEDAKVIVAGGGGLDGPEGFKLIKELADLLRGSVGASRVPVDEDWVPLSMEIGQTGGNRGPDSQIARGISGASQHITGCLNSLKQSSRSIRVLMQIYLRYRILVLWLITKLYFLYL